LQTVRGLHRITSLVIKDAEEFVADRMHST
jgi:hypothetical protein